MRRAHLAYGFCNSVFVLEASLIPVPAAAVGARSGLRGFLSHSMLARPLVRDGGGGSAPAAAAYLTCVPTCQYHKEFHSGHAQ